MLLFATLYALSAIAVSVLAFHLASRLLRIDVAATLVFLGLAEWPPVAPPRQRPRRGSGLRYASRITSTTITRSAATEI